MQSVTDIEKAQPDHGGAQRDSSDHVYQIIYVSNNDERVKVVEVPTIPFESVLTWLQLGNSIFITQKQL